MDRELLIEIGCEEIPAGWLPGLTAQLATASRRASERVPADDRQAPAEGFSTPRRLTARVAQARRAADRLRGAGHRPARVGGVQAGRRADAGGGRLRQEIRRRGRRARAARDAEGRVPRLPRAAARQGHGRRARRRHGRPAARHDVPEADALGRLSRGRQGRPACSPGRSAGWCCSTAAASCRSSSAAPSWRRARRCRTSAPGANTYGHRFLTTSGRAGRAIKVKTFDDYQARLLENFVILDRAERESKIRRELETHARRLGGRVSGLVAAQSSLLQEVPDLVEYPVGRRRPLPGGVPRSCPRKC